MKKNKDSKASRNDPAYAHKFLLTHPVISLFFTLLSFVLGLVLFVYPRAERPSDAFAPYIFWPIAIIFLAYSIKAFANKAQK